MMLVVEDVVETKKNMRGNTGAGRASISDLTVL